MSPKYLVLLIALVVYSSAAPTQQKSCEFQCQVGKCVPSSWYCDMVKDCANGKDEDGCRYLHDCKPGQYMCKSGECLKADIKCNGVSDCTDGSDERDCSTLQGLPSSDDYEHKMQHLVVPPVIVPVQHESAKDDNLPSINDHEHGMQHVEVPPVVMSEPPHETATRTTSGFSWIGTILLILCLLILVVAFVVIYFRLWPTLCDRLDDILGLGKYSAGNITVGFNNTADLM